VDGRRPRKRCNRKAHCDAVHPSRQLAAVHRDKQSECTAPTNAILGIAVAPYQEPVFIQPKSLQKNARFSGKIGTLCILL
jgi:hypothetical protein